MSWAINHSQSEKLAVLAELAIRNGDFETAKKLYFEAADFETKAFNEVPIGKIRTFGITCVSASSLWFKAIEYQRSEEIAYQGLSNRELPTFASIQLKEIIQTIWDNLVLERAGVQLSKGSILFSVSGGKVVHGGAPLDLVQTKVDQVEKYIYRLLEFNLKVPFRKAGLPSQEIREKFSPYLCQAPAGSYQFAVKINEPLQSPLFSEGGPGTVEIADSFLDIVRASIEAPTSELKEMVPDLDYRKIFLQMTKNIIPSGKTHEKLEIRVVESQQRFPVVIHSHHRDQVHEAIRELEPKKDRRSEKILRFKGTLRGLQLDADWIEIDRTEDNKPIRIHEAGDNIDDLIGPMVNHQVIVDVIVKNKYYSYKDIQLDE